MNLFRRGGLYAGRLAFDHDSGFHLADDGRKVLTTDGGRTWRYAKRGDTSHQERYQKNAVLVKGTTGEDPHDAQPTQDDAHLNGLIFTVDDGAAAKETSHTDAWA